MHEKGPYFKKRNAAVNDIATGKSSILKNGNIP